MRALIPAVIALLTVDSRAKAQQTFPIPSDFGQPTTLSISGAGTLKTGKLDELLNNPSGRGSVLFTPTNSFSLYTTYNATGGSTNIPVESFRVEQIIFPDLSNRSFVIGLSLGRPSTDADAKKLIEHGGFIEVNYQAVTFSRTGDAGSYPVTFVGGAIGYQFRYDKYVSPNRFRVSFSAGAHGYSAFDGESARAFHQAFQGQSISPSHLGAGGKLAIQFDDVTIIEIGCQWLPNHKDETRQVLSGGHCTFGPSVSGTLVRF